MYEVAPINVGGTHWFDMFLGVTHTHTHTHTGHKSCIELPKRYTLGHIKHHKTALLCHPTTVFFLCEVNWERNTSFSLLPAVRPEQLFELDDVLYMVETKIAGTSAHMVVDTGGWMNMVGLSFKDWWDWGCGVVGPGVVTSTVMV